MTCEECARKDRIIRVLHEQSENYRHDANLWKVNLFHVQEQLAKMIDRAKDLRWYPSDRETRGDGGATQQEKGWIEVQKDRQNPIPDPVEQTEYDDARLKR